MIPKPLVLIDTEIIGGPGRGIIQLATSLREKKRECLICTFTRRNQRSHEFENELRRLQLTAATVWQAASFDPRPIVDVSRIATRGGFNIIQSHGYKSHLVACAASCLAGIAWVAFTHGWTRENKIVALYHSLDALSLRFADAAIAVSPQLYKWLQRVRGPGRHTHLVLNAVDPNGLEGGGGGAALRDELGLEGDDFFVGCFGRLSYEKGQDVLLRAIAQVAHTSCKVVLLLVGSGPEDTNLRRLALKLGITDRVVFKGHTTQLRDCYEALDLLVVPSRSEGLPNVLLEAASLGVPAIATDVGAVTQVITGGESGWIVPPDDQESLAMALKDAMSSRELRNAFGSKSKSIVKEKFCPRGRADRIYQIYGEVLSEEGSETRLLSSARD